MLQGHQKVEYIDNLQDEPLLYAYFPGFITDYMARQDMFKELGNLPVFKKLDRLKSSGIQNKNLLPLYSYMNNEEFQQLDFEAQWEIWLKTNFPSKSDLSRYALWEMRNLQIAANIMRVVAFYPGKKIIIIIGGSHKRFIEKYLKQSPNINLLSL